MKQSSTTSETPEKPSAKTCSQGSGRLRADTLLSSVVLLLGVSVIQRTVGFGRGILFCRWLSPEELGRWEMAYSFLLLAAPLAVLGLPGSFGRYLEHFRQRGQLRNFLTRTSLWTGLLGFIAVAAICFGAPFFANVIFGESSATDETIVIGVCLAMVILHHFLEAIFTAMRMFRIVSVMHFGQSMGFAALGLSLLVWWRMEAMSIVIAYGVACLVSSTVAILWARKVVHEVPKDTSKTPQSVFWAKLMRFAIWIWVTNLLCNLFAVVDRYMLIHYAGLTAKEALAQVGHYHSSRVVPLLIISVTELLSGVVLPYLSKDWEAGDRDGVSNRLKFVTKLCSLGMLLGGVLVLMIAPWLFEVAFRGKYNGGLAILPMTLAYCMLFGLTTLVQNYLWCAEKGKLCTLPTAIGLAGNVALNFALLPWLGLYGAVVATTIANIACLAITFWLCHSVGMKLDAGLLVLSAAPLAICAGWEITLALIVAFLLIGSTRVWLFNTDEKEQIAEFVKKHILSKLPQRKPAPQP